MPGAAPTLADIDKTLDAILQPLRDQLAVIDGELAALDERKRELREVRSRISRLIGANDHKKPGPKAPGAKKGLPSTERLDLVESYLRRRLDGKEFTVPDVVARRDWEEAVGVQGAYANALMNGLHERGTLRLVRTGHPEYGNRTKIWRLTPNAKSQA